MIQDLSIENLKQFKSKATQLDEEDAISHFRDKFYIPKKNGAPSTYLVGNSLGLQAKITSDAINKELQNWSEKGVEGHHEPNISWISHHHLSKPILSRLLGAKDTEVCAMNNLTTNLHLALISFYQPNGKRKKILMERGSFPSDYYAVHSQIVQRGLDPEECLVELKSPHHSCCLSTEEIVDAIEKMSDELALALFPGIQYYSGQAFDIGKISRAAHSVGAYAGYDLAHAIGNIPMNLHLDEVDFAVWCSYKYLNSGPGGIGGLYIHEKHGKNTKLARLSGWWGHDSTARFEMTNQLNPIPNVDGWQLSNTNILSHATHLAALSLFEEVSIQQLREKSILLTGLLEEVLNSSKILRENVTILTPSVASERGCQLSLYLTNHGKEIFNQLTKKGIVVDWREPRVIRVAPVPFYNTFSDVIQFAQELENAISRK